MRNSDEVYKRLLERADAYKKEHPEAPKRGGSRLRVALLVAGVLLICIAALLIRNRLLSGKKTPATSGGRISEVVKQPETETPSPTAEQVRYTDYAKTELSEDGHTVSVTTANTDPTITASVTVSYGYIDLNKELYFVQTEECESSGGTAEVTINLSDTEKLIRIESEHRLYSNGECLSEQETVYYSE